MVITRRNVNGSSQGLRSTTEVLEREDAYAYYEQPAENMEVLTELKDRERMSKNLAYILNYETYAEQVQEVELAPEVANETVTEVKAEAKIINDEDIMPTSTTLQFGDGQADVILNDLRKENQVSSVSNNQKYRLSASGKVLVTLYAIVVATIIALIVVNTSILAGLKTSVATKQAELNGVMNQYVEASARLDEISSDQHVIDVAENEYNMVK